MENSQHGKQSMRQWVADYFAIARILRHRFQESKTKRRDFRLLLENIKYGEIASHRALYAITCPYCSPLMYENMSKMRTINLAGLRIDCSTCQIIKKATARFASASDQVVLIDYNKAHEGIVLEYWTPAGDFIVHIQSTEPSTPRHPFPPIKSSVSCDPAAPSTVGLIQGWLTECEKDHIECKAYSEEPKSLPTRLLQILGEDSVCLVQPVHSTKYTALTYCWGTTEQPITTAENKSSRFQDFNSKNFPQTLRDAIRYSRALEINYIWIDCLCIVQDDKDDWAAEAACLADIYSGAFVVLAATRSHDVAEGFLQFREDPYKISFTRGRKPPCTVQARHVRSHSFTAFDMNLSGQPLCERGWCMQERLLACRIVHFLPDEVFFECRQGAHCECGLLQLSSVRAKTLWPIAKLYDRVVKDEKIKGYIVFRQWKIISEGFSRLKLTYPQDVLPALSGIAKRAALLSPGKYLAGIWEGGIALHLGWYRSPVSQHTHSIEQSERNYRPTFSWTSSPDPISYQYVFEDAQAAICTYLDGDSTKSTIDPFGEVSSARLRLKGRCVKGLSLLEGLNDSENHTYDAGEHLSANYLTVHIDNGLMYGPLYEGEARAVISYEAVAEALDWDTIKCFGLFHMSVYNGPVRATLLLLDPAPDGSSYVRVGLVKQLPYAWFDKHATECEVTIV